LCQLEEWLLSDGPASVEAELEGIRRFVATRLANLRKLLYTDVERARLELGKRITEIRMLPESTGKESHYMAAAKGTCWAATTTGPRK